LTSSPKAGNFYQLMITIVLILAFLLGVGSGVFIWFILQRQRRPRGKALNKSPSKPALTFRWRYIALPLSILFIAVIITLFFYHILPADVAYHFEKGIPDRWLSQTVIIGLMMVPQILLTMLAAAVVGITIRLSVRFPAVPAPLVERMLSIMGNMVALPQLVLAFAMLNIFSYNSYQIRLMSSWVFALIVMGLGLVVLGVLFAVAIRQVTAFRGKI